MIEPTEPNFYILASQYPQICHFRVMHEVHSTLTISRVTEEMYNWVYECVVSKVDVPSAYDGLLQTMTLHSAIKANTNYTGVVPLPEEDSEYERLHYYDNNTSACSIREPCTSRVTLQLVPLGWLLKHFRSVLFLSLLGNVAVVFLVAELSSFGIVQVKCLLILAKGLRFLMSTPCGVG